MSYREGSFTKPRRFKRAEAAQKSSTMEHNRSLEDKFQSFKQNPVLIEKKIYQETQRLLEAKRTSSNKLPGDEIERREKLDIKRQVLREVIEELGKPQFYNNPKVKARINRGAQVFEKVYGREETKDNGYTKLLSKILESNLTVRQIKNGQGLFDKDVMKRKYNNPYFEVASLKEQLQ